MAYPKPLSEKTLVRMVRDAKIDEDMNSFLHKFFLAAVHLYGVVILSDLWQILKEVANLYGMSHIKRKDLIAFSSIVRREKVPYYVFEIDELYSEEKRSDLKRELVHKSLIGANSFKTDYFRLSNMQADKTYYIPNDILSFVNIKRSPEEIRLLNYLKKLKVTARSVEGTAGKRIPCKYVGKTLGKFSFRNHHEDFEYRYYNGEIKEHGRKNERILNEIIEKTKGSEADKIVRMYKQNCNIGYQDSTAGFSLVFNELYEVGVELSQKRMNELADLLMQFNNNSHLWCNRGWTPSDLLQQKHTKGPLNISIGPNMKKFIEEGRIDMDAFIEMCNQHGIEWSK